MNQGTDSWRQWRSKGIGSSDAPVIMGCSPWSTPYKLWLEKIGEDPPREDTWITDKGQRLEPMARAHYELITSNDMPPAVVENFDYPWMRASLDGYNPTLGIVLEIKYAGAKDHASAACGNVPDKYKWQLQHQLAVTGAAVAHYYSFNGEQGHLVVVQPNPTMIAELVKEELRFWELVQTRTAPPFTDKDVRVSTDSELGRLLSQYNAALEQEKEAKAESEALKAKILEINGDCPKTSCNGFTISRVSRAGTVDYGRIPELKGVNLDQYRKKPSTYWEIRSEKGQTRPGRTNHSAVAEEVGSHGA